LDWADFACADDAARGGFQLVPDALLVKQESCYFGQSDQAGLYQGACLEIEVTTALGAPELHEFEATAIDRE
jgi:hypothetical protein